MSKLFNIAAQAVSATAALHLKSADGEHLFDAAGQPLRIVIFGPGSKEFAAIEARQTNRAVRRMQDNDGKVSMAPPEQRAAEEAEDLAALTVRFENFEYPTADDAQGAEQFAALYRDKTLGFIPAQVKKFIADWGNFKAASLTA